jgi:hypothetical protein
MRKHFIISSIVLIFILTGINNYLNKESYHAVLTTSFGLIELVTYAVISILSLRALRSFKDINYLYFAFVNIVLFLILFFVTTKNLTFSYFDKLFFTQIKFVQIVFFAFSLFLVRVEKKRVVGNTVFLIILLGNSLCAYKYFGLGVMKYFPLIVYLELVVLFSFFTEKKFRKVLIEVITYNLVSEFFYLDYLENGKPFFYIATLVFHLTSIFTIVYYLLLVLNRDYYRKEYIKEKKSSRLLNINEKPIILLHEFNIKKINKSALKVLGYGHSGEVKGKNIFNFLNIMDFENVQLDEGLEGRNKKVTLSKKDGTPISMIIDIYKIQEGKSTEYILEFNEEVNFGDIFYKVNNELETVVFIYEEEEGYKYVSDGVYDVLGYYPKDFYGDKWFTKKISLDSKFEKMLKNKDGKVSFMSKYKNKNGNIVYLKENIKRISLENRNIYYGIVTDISEFISEIDNLNLSKKDLEEKNVKTEMSMSIVSHEIRTPITAIIGFLENIIMNNKDFPKTIDNMIKKAYSNAMRLKELINNLLDLNKLNAGKLEIYEENNDLKALVEEILLNNETLMEIKNIKVINEIEEKKEVISDSAMLYQIINNVVTNSIKYNKDSGELRVSMVEEGNSIVLAISDTGIGISEENKERVFLEYKRIKGSKEKGTGLGLPLAKKLIELNGGNIWFHSEINKGTTFFLRFKKV